MNKLSSLLIVFLISSVNVRAQYTQLPVIPSSVYNIKDDGAVGDNKTLNTEAIQKALDKARSTGGKVLIPPGEFLCGPLKIYSKTELEIAKGATLRLRNDMESFPAANGRYLNFIDISKATDIKISGGGTIDGQGEPWWKATEAKTLTLRRPQIVYIEGTQRVEISGVTFLNPPNTHVSLKSCTDVYIRDITIQAPANSHNTDGINISAKNCTIEHCTINTGDDNIAVNFGNKQQSENDPEVKNMVIKNCTFGYGHGLSIGSYTSGGLTGLFVSDCTFDGTTSGIRIKTARGRGGILDNVNYQNITIKNSRYPIFISEYYPREPKTPQEDVITTTGDHNPVYKNILLKNITVTNSQEGLILWGIPESPVQRVRFENVQISAKFGAQIYNAAKVEFVNSAISAGSGEKVRSYQSSITGLN
ncbi:MAG: glycosyl hydrolase family 28 protein [Mucilaginibacter sp.]|uniref:glycoside hydrolase family 28 protein n=1 Tax=Mucilaginibacter sp. TaxID=1882438 RepID=UPI003266C958